MYNGRAMKSVVDLQTAEHLVTAHLLELLASPAFRSTQRSQEFLRYAVAETVAGRHDNLKERIIGQQVFGREVGYDTGQDSIVRVKANEVRKRLAQYYEQHPQASLRIEMAAGSYGVQILQAEETAPEVVSRVERRSWWRPMAAAGGVLLVLLALTSQRWGSAPQTATPLIQFWQPFLAGTQPLLLCLPAPETFRIYGSEKVQLVQALRARAPGTTGARPAVPTRDVMIVPEPGMFVGLGDARAMSLLYSFGASQGKAVQMRASAMTTFGDLSAGPSVIIGGESNQWHGDLTADHRFLLTKFGGHHVILDRKSAQPLCTKPHTWEPASSSDCAVVSRMPRSKTGRPLMIAAGLDHSGTFAVGEFLTSAKLMAAALRRLGPHWENKNVQLVLRVEKLRDGVGTPELLAAHAW